MDVGLDHGAVAAHLLPVLDAPTPRMAALWASRVAGDSRLMFSCHVLASGRSSAKPNRQSRRNVLESSTWKAS